jgi:hypothetical protein
MEIIGTTSHGYICNVSHDELEKLVDKYYGKLKRLEVGSKMDLGAGYDFRSQIQSACRGMVDASKGFSAAQSSMMRFAVMVSQLPVPHADGANTEAA